MVCELHKRKLRVRSDSNSSFCVAFGNRVFQALKLSSCEAGDLFPFFRPAYFAMRRVVTTLLFAMRRPRLFRLAGGRAPKGRRGSHAHGNNTGRIHGQHKRVGKRGKSLLCMGNPSLQGGGVLPPDGQTLCLIYFKSVAAYQRGSMKPFFPTEFRLRRVFSARASDGKQGI